MAVGAPDAHSGITPVIYHVGYDTGGHPLYNPGVSHTTIKPDTITMITQLAPKTLYGPDATAQAHQMSVHANATYAKVMATPPPPPPRRVA